MSAYNGKVTVWIQKEDREKWDKIENKPEWLHEHLNGKPFTPTYIQDGKKVTTKNIFPTQLTEPALDNLEPKLTPPEDSV